MKHLILFKNNTVQMKSNLQKILKTKYNDIRFMLFNLKDTNLTFLLHKVFDYMPNFKKAEISVEMVVVRNSLEKELKAESPDYTRLKSIDMEITELDDFISYLHSLNKIRYTNKLANSNESSDYDMICFTKFQIKIFNQTSCVYKKKLIGVLSPTDILESIKDIYNPIMIEDSYISIDNGNWDITSNLTNNNALYGICYHYTKTFEFFYNDVFKALLNVKSVYCASFVYDDQTVNLSGITRDELYQCNFISGTLRFHDIWYSDRRYYLEYISYFGAVQTNLTVSSELAEFNELNNRMVMNSEFMIELISKNHGSVEIKKEITTPDIITIAEFIKLVDM